MGVGPHAQLINEDTYMDPIVRRIDSRMARKLTLLGTAACFLGLVTPRAASAQVSPPPPPPPGIELGGLLDGYYDFYSTKPAGDAQLRSFDTKHNQFALSMAEVWLAKAPTEDSRSGFKVKLSFGPASTNLIHASEPGGAAFQNIQEAYVSYLAPAGRGVQVDAGIFVTSVGAEVIEAKDDYNYSRSLLFTLAEPAYHAGVRATTSPSDKVTLMGGLVNGWNNAVENNTGKTLMGGLTLKPTGVLTLVETYLVGPETPGTNDGWRHLSDTVLTYTAGPRLSLMANYDYGRDHGVHWQGIAGYLKYQPTQAIAFSPRFEFYDDASGFTTGTVQKVKELTGTLEVKVDDDLMWRVEYRADISNASVFADSAGGAARNHQQSISFGLLYSFTRKIH